MRGVLKPREERLVNDSYYTPDALALAICTRLREVAGFRSPILEPNAGGGAFVKAAREVWEDASVTGEDISGDWASPGQWTNLFELALGNPPFSSAEAQVRATIPRLAPLGYLAFILRLSFLAGQRRAALYEKHPLRYLIPITPRPSFTPDGKTDASDYGLFVWQRGYEGTAEILPHLRWTR